MQLVWVESRRKTISSTALKAQKFWSTIQGLCHCSWWLCRYHLIISFRRSPVHCTFVYRCTLQHTPHLIIGKNQQEMLNWRIITQGFWLSGTKAISLLTSLECNILALHCIALYGNGMHSHITTPGVTIRGTIMGRRVVDAKNAILLNRNHHQHHCIADLYISIHWCFAQKCWQCPILCHTVLELVYDAWHADMNWVLGKVSGAPGFAAPARQVPLGH